MTGYYVDYTNGNDAHDGSAERSKTTEAGTTTTKIVCTGLAKSSDDAYNGDFLWNRTRGAGSLITDFVHSTHELTLGSTIAGQTTGDEFYILKAWKTVGKALTTMVAGDTALVRVGTTETLSASLTVTNSGSSTARICLWGTANGTTTIETTDNTYLEAWHDASVTRPILNFNNAAYYLSLSKSNTDIHLKNLDMRNTNSASYGVLNVRNTTRITVDYCIFRDAGNASGSGVRTSQSVVAFSSCDFTNNGYAGVWDEGGSVLTFSYCTFDSGANVTDYGVISKGGATIYVQMSAFGGTSTHNTADICSGAPSDIINLRAVTLASSTKVVFDTTTNNGTGYVTAQDAEKVFNDQVSYSDKATITRETSIVRSGGSLSSLKIMPTSLVAAQNVAYPNLRTPIPLIALWVPEAGTYTVTVYIRSVGTWGGTYPTPGITVGYVSNITSGSTAWSAGVTSVTLTNDTDWVPFAVSVSPVAASFLLINLTLAKYVASCGLYVDLAPSVVKTA